MQHYESKIDAALNYLLEPGLLNVTGDRPICYLIYDVEDALKIQKMIDSDIEAKAAHAGFEIHKISIKDLVTEYIKNHEYFDDAWNLKEGVAEEEIFDSIRTEFQDSEYLANKILEKQEELKGNGRPLMLFTDLEWLHPFDKIGRVEQIVYKRIEIPMMVLYPGKSQGTARTFLNIYPMDGNYRSKNF